MRYDERDIATTLRTYRSKIYQADFDHIFEELQKTEIAYAGLYCTRQKASGAPRCSTGLTIALQKDVFHESI